MIDKKTRFWLDFQNNKINRNLTKEEEKMLKEANDKVNTWMPNKALFKLIGKENIMKYNLYDDTEVIKILSEAFIVEQEVSKVKLRALSIELRKERLTETLNEIKKEPKQKKMNYKGNIY